MMEHEITIENMQSETNDLPDVDLIRSWVNKVLCQQNTKAVELTIRLLSEQEIASLNEKYRHVAKATNVLSFPVEMHEEIELHLQPLGDIVICPQVLATEAQAQDKALVAHWAHIVIHGVLHLLGFDHVEDNEAAAMERLEVELLEEMGYSNPY